MKTCVIEVENIEKEATLKTGEMSSKIEYISERPEILDAKERLGDLEIDTIVKALLITNNSISGL